ncbi:MAG: Uncharacterized protein XE11_2818 [Methanomicrobiales archaeon 53_19]|nr:MAG: Uncharacterized protein XE11_2818 [Methanomicrobiales archaeon 53_19]
MKKLTYLDSSVLIQAYRGEGVSGERAMRVLDDPDREFVVSDFLKLEVLPKPIFHAREDEVAFMTAIIQNAKDIRPQRE